ncbi:MAG: hypothetical protein LBF04_02165 [Prevotellaceae bacterium]|jgi:hypothetical protein|nr:hypothetical protein [Prevotellaceae bacterium]
MKKQKKIINEFKNWYDNQIPFAQRDFFKEKIIEQCIPQKEKKLQLFIFENWLHGRSHIPDLAKPIIEQIAGKKIFKI